MSKKAASLTIDYPEQWADPSRTKTGHAVCTILQSTAPEPERSSTTRSTRNICDPQDSLAMPVKHRETLNHLYQRYFADICKYVNKTFGCGPPEPEDVAQDVFARYAALDDPTAVENPRAFLYRSAHNIVISHHRKSAAQNRYLINQDSNDPTREHDNVHPERQLISREKLNLLERVIGRMPTRRRRILVLNRFDGLTYAQIARQTGLSHTAVKKHVVRALTDLQKALGKAEWLETEQ